MGGINMVEMFYYAFAWAPNLCERWGASLWTTEPERTGWPDRATGPFTTPLPCLPRPLLFNPAAAFLIRLVGGNNSGDEHGGLPTDVPARLATGRS